MFQHNREEIRHAGKTYLPYQLRLVGVQWDIADNPDFYHVLVLIDEAPIEVNWYGSFDFAELFYMIDRYRIGRVFS